MSGINDGGPAFPLVELDRITGAPCDQHFGMSLRDFFAIKSLPLAWQVEQLRPTGPYSEHMEPTYEGAARRAYFMADAMLKARTDGSKQA